MGGNKMTIPVKLVTNIPNTNIQKIEDAQIEINEIQFQNLALMIGQELKRLGIIK